MKRGRKRNARTALLWGLAGFLVIQLGLAAAIELRLPSLRDPEYTQKADRLHQRLAGPDRPECVVMLGSSRTAFGLSGTPVEKELATPLGRPPVVFNFGQWGAGPVTHLLTLHRMLADGVRPDLVLVEVLPTFLARGDGERLEMSRLTADRVSLEELELLERCGIPVKEQRREWWPGRPFPSYTHRFAILNNVFPVYLPQSLRVEWKQNPDPSCFVPQMTWGNLGALHTAGVGRAYREHGAVLQDFHLGNTAAAALRETLALCRREKIRAALVLMPEGSVFRGWYPPEVNRQIVELLEALGHEQGAPLIDTRTWIADTNFSDAHHLLPSGANEFSLRLGREVMLPLLREPRSE